MKQELAIGTRVQTCILPRHVDVAGLEIAATMVPATEVAGDYYDVLPVADGAWIAIGDVAGHGLTAGLMMIMLQSAISTAVRTSPTARPSEVLAVVNEVLFENIHGRMGDHAHATISLLRYRGDGCLVFAGAHEEMVLWSAASGRVELVDTPGTWLSVARDIRAATVDSQLTLEEGDLLILYTDGVTEARRGPREQFGVERLCEVVRRSAREPALVVRDRILEEVARWAPHRDDDRTVVAIRAR
jgi:sigma-B regulation protein RsbU (phosphoserine phosphatase)